MDLKVKHRCYHPECDASTENDGDNSGVCDKCPLWICSEHFDIYSKCPKCKCRMNFVYEKMNYEKMNYGTEIKCFHEGCTEIKGLQTNTEKECYNCSIWICVTHICDYSNCPKCGKHLDYIECNDQCSYISEYNSQCHKSARDCGASSYCCDRWLCDRHSGEIKYCGSCGRLLEYSIH